MEDLVIVGAGGASREIAEAVEAINEVAPRWNLLGFLDDDTAKHGQRIHDYPVLGGTLAAREHPSSRFIIGIAHYRAPRARRDVFERMAIPRDRFATLVHPSAIVSRRAVLGAGTAILSHSHIGHDTVIGDHVIVSSLCCIGHDVRVGDYVTLSDAVVVTSAVEVDRGAYLGARSVLLNGVTIGEGALVGIGSVVLKPAPPHMTVLGTPARVRGERESR
jgi:sugar O-acyltransferase (sialic acid O-acetyltransferase NeuD family)